MSDGTVRAKCWERVPRNTRRTHERHCRGCDRVIPPPSPYAPIACGVCKRRFTPRTSNQRTCGHACRKMFAPDRGGIGLAKDVTEMRHIIKARRRVNDAAIVAAWSLEQRRKRAWNSWVDCLGLPEAMKEAA
jgi:hypothetical protein